MSTEGDWSITVREDAGDDVEEAAGLAVADAARAERRRSDELTAELAADAAAVRAFTEKRETEYDDDEDWEPFREGIASYDPRSEDEPVALVVMDGQVRRQFAPYDYDWRWGNPSVNVSDRVGGLVNTEGRSRDRNPTKGACGVGTFLRSGRVATIRVLPYVTYDWNYYVRASAVLSNATVTGGLDLSAWSAGALVSEVRQTRLFRRRVSVGESRSDRGRGSVWAGSFQIDFPAVPGRHYEISVGAWLECKHHEGVGINAWANAAIKGRVERVEFYRFLPV